MVVAKNPVQSRKKTASKARPSEPASASSAPNAGNYTVGSQVSHPMFGDGTVTAIDGDKLTIEFKGKVMKQIVEWYVKPRKH